MKRFLLSCLTLTFLVLASCGTGPEEVDKNPDVAISKIDGPLAATTAASGGAGGIQGDTIDLLAPGSGPPIIAASELFDPVTGTSSANSLSVYVTASDELGVVQVELFYNGTSVGTRTKEQDGIQFKNPFIFPNPRSGQNSVPIQGEAIGLLGSQLRAVATDSAGQVTESEVVNLQADGSRPDINVSVTGDGPPYIGSAILSVQAVDPETGIAGFEVYRDGNPEPEELSPPTSYDEVLEPGSHTFRFVAINGVGATNERTVTFVVAEPPAPPVEPDNTPPTVALTANPPFGDAPLAVIFTANAQDEDGDELTYAWDFGNGATASSGNTQSTTYAEDGTYTATVTVSDGVSEVVATTPVIVGDGSGNGGGGDDNEAPTVTIDGEATRAVDPNTAAPLSATASDPEGDTLTYNWSAEPSEGVTFSAATATTTDVTFASAGVYTVTLTASDGNGGVASDSVTFTVGGDDGGGGGNTDAPTISSFTATPSEPVTPNTNVTLAWVLTGSPTTVTITPEGGEATDVTGDSTLTVTPATTTTYTLNASNATGAADPQTVTVTVQGEDDTGGVNAVDDTADTTPGEPVTVDVLANDEPGADALIIVAATSPQQGGAVQISRDSKTITYTPKNGFTGEDAFSYTVRDDEGNRSTAKVTVQVGPAG